MSGQKITFTAVFYALPFTLFIYWSLQRTLFFSCLVWLLFTALDYTCMVDCLQSTAYSEWQTSSHVNVYAQLPHLRWSSQQYRRVTVGTHAFPTFHFPVTAALTCHTLPASGKCHINYLWHAYFHNTHFQFHYPLPMTQIQYRFRIRLDILLL